MKRLKGFEATVCTTRGDPVRYNQENGRLMHMVGEPWRCGPIETRTIVVVPLNDILGELRESGLHNMALAMERDILEPLTDTATLRGS
jgi:hypothetical protein